MSSVTIYKAQRCHNSCFLGAVPLSFYMWPLTSFPVFWGKFWELAKIVQMTLSWPMEMCGVHDVIMTVSSATCLDLRTQSRLIWAGKWESGPHDVIMTASLVTCLDLLRTMQMGLSWPMRAQGINTAQARNEELVYQKLKLPSIIGLARNEVFSQSSRKRSQEILVKEKPPNLLFSAQLLLVRNTHTHSLTHLLSPTNNPTHINLLMITHSHLHIN